VPSVPHSVNKIFTERRNLPSAALGKVGFAECPIKSTRQSRRHLAKSRIPVVREYYLRYDNCLRGKYLESLFFFFFLLEYTRYEDLGDSSY
jgi:hypothetical protein